MPSASASEPAERTGVGVRVLRGAAVHVLPNCMRVNTVCGRTGS
jgi:hypothetical protein